MSSAQIAKARLGAALGADRAVQSARAQMAPVIARAHEVTRPSRNRKLARDWGSGNAIAGMDARQLRDQARHLERDLDLADNALNVLVQNTVGAGIDVLSAPRLPGQPINRELALQLDDLWDAWWDAPEATRTHDYGMCQQLLARSWFRDGDAFYQDLIGTVPYFEHGTAVPYSFEMLEADLVPLDFNDPARNILQGVERNAWGRPIAFHVYKSHPGDPMGTRLETKRVSAEFMHCIALMKRLHQVRGLSVFASAMSRFEDVKDYEESERIAAKVAASMTFQIKKGSGEQYGADLGGQAILQDGVPIRELRLAPGAIFDDLLPGESIESLGTDRPNPNAATWRKEQLRAAAGGIGVSYSSLSLDYNGTYSAQRQELVEKWGSYLMLAERFIALCVRPQRMRFVEACVLSGRVRLPRGWTLRDLAASTYVRPVMPWIDPLKEAYARGEAEDRGWVSPQQNTLQYGNNPAEVLRQRQDWQEQTQTLAPPAPNTSAEARAQVLGQLTRDLSRSE
ncbi:MULTISPECIES: phage portal protein [Stenotrophomonas]|uniref:phage portal protein n=1 Tax=Stenotrophomonas maltophilia TaxID=40324 RepID=UPI000DA74724|nr:phage portal protein [Stenotrophomonas maltophilia]EKT4100282.1 phage portal protein [Stenotrophomonas maltophilia]ELN2585478.1 phage portal protein [Stenotrophomonas maltophilia]ELN2593799.1 phage portal protein [Stenotrophomonas maltophilia]MBH1400526.1 phage portal protein [Stenotrophomonas maltophilia]MBN5138255.1 phage portal protein [Stenotrophomonas maltophilia]